MSEKYLGKIKKCGFGHMGYQEACLGVYFDFEFDKSSGISDHTHCAWDPEIIDGEHSEWDESDRDLAMAATMRFVSKLLKEAKVHDFSQLVGKPVEIEFERMALKSWRILTEVI